MPRKGTRITRSIEPGGPRPRPWERGGRPLLLRPNLKKYGGRPGKSYKDNWSTYIYVFPSPVICAEISSTIESGSFVIYPPFSVSHKSLTRKALKDTKIPVLNGGRRLDMAIPPFALMDMDLLFDELSGSLKCHGLRIDKIDSREIDRTIDLLFHAIRQYTRQWWITSHFNPFDSGIRISGLIDEKNRPLDGPITVEGDIKNSWSYATSYEHLIGIEVPLCEKQWDNVRKCVLSDSGIESAIQIFMDCIADYRAFYNDEFIFKAWLLVEHCEMKARFRLKRKDYKSYGKDIFRHSVVIQHGSKEILEQLLADRGRIAHGGRPSSALNERRMELYMENAHAVLNAYLDIARENWSAFLEAEY